MLSIVTANTNKTYNTWAVCDTKTKFKFKTYCLATGDVRIWVVGMVGDVRVKEGTMPAVVAPAAVGYHI